MVIGKIGPILEMGGGSTVNSHLNPAAAAGPSIAGAVTHIFSHVTTVILKQLLKGSLGMPSGRNGIKWELSFLSIIIPRTKY